MLHIGVLQMNETDEASTTVAVAML